MEKQLLNKYHFLQGGGEMGELTRKFDWSQTPVGSPDEWPSCLRTTLAMILSSKFPMFLWWGDDLIQFYNDAYRPSLGNNGKHPVALGQKAKDCWPEIWDFIFPLIEQVRKTGVATWNEDQYLPIYRNGKMEDVYWTFGYSPIWGETDEVEGVLVVCNETTEKVQSLHKLEASNQQFRNLVMQAPVAIAVYRGPDLIVDIANEAYLPLVGKTMEEFVGRPLFEVLPEAKETLQPIINSVMHTGIPYQFNEFGIVLNRFGRDETAYFNFVYEPIRELNGDINGFIAVGHEVTEQVIARKELEKREEQIRSLVESAPFPIGVYEGREMRIVLANQALIDAWGKGNDVVGKLYSEVLTELEKEIYKQLDNVYTTGIPYHAKNRRVDLLVAGKLQPYFFNYSFTPVFDSSGKVYGVMNTAADVTDLNLIRQKLEKSEQNLKNTILRAPVAMCILRGPEYVVELGNDKIFELWGHSREEMIGKPIFEGLPEAKDQGFEKLLHDVYTTGEPFSAQGVPVNLPRQGKIEQVYINFLYEPYREVDDDSVIGILAVAIDVTDQVRARHKIEDIVSARTKELADANQNLERSNAELAQFAYIASHDLQEPLRKISTFAQMLEHGLGNIDPQSQKYLDKINSSSSRMINLIRDVLTYSQLSKSKPKYEKVDLNKVLEEIRTDFELLIEQKGARLESGELPVIEAIPLQMSQLFGNLVSNALKFSQPDVKPVIGIRATRIAKEELEHYSLPEKEGGYYRIEFRDNGIGFRPQYAEQIFNIFQRLHRKAEYEGTGIGLAMCKKIAQNHNGDIYAKGSMDGGAIFYVILPEKQ